jgi:ATP-dependent DNA ligase
LSESGLLREENFRIGNAIFEPVWNRRYINHVQFITAESIGVEGRGAFYETACAFRDVMQSQKFMLLLTEPVKKRPPTAARLPAFVEPMKAKLLDFMPTGDWIYEIKFNGYRALSLRAAGETRILSRNEKGLGSKFPAAGDSIAAFNVQNAIIDGEIVALDEKGRSSFQLLQDIGITTPAAVSREVGLGYVEWRKKRGGERNMLSTS